MRSFRLAFRTFLAVATFTVLPLVAIADPPLANQTGDGGAQGDAKPAESSASDSKPAESSSSESKPSESKPSESKPTDVTATPEASPPKSTDVLATDNPQVFKLFDETIELTLPEKYGIKKTDSQGGTEYAFSAPRNADGTVAGVMFFLIPVNPAAEIPPAKAVLQMIMTPGQSNLKEFQQQPGEPAVINGVTFENANYSGVAPNGKALKGFFFVGRVKSGFLILAGRDGADHYKDSEATLRGIVDSCKVR